MAAGSISVVIPCYGQAQYLAEAVQSALAQQVPALEVLVVNDGSPDETGAVARSFGGRIRYIEQENRGLAAARNTGIRAARGDYIALLDSDDVCLPGRLATQAACMDARPAVGLVASDALLYDGGRLLGLKSEQSGAPRNAADFRYETVSYCPTPSTMLLRRAAVLAPGGFDERLRRAGEDWLLAVQMARHWSLAYLPLPTVLYRVHPASASSDTELLHAENRRAAALAVAWEQFPGYPAHFRARLLWYRCATGWRVEPKGAVLRYALRAALTDPTQVGEGLQVARAALAKRLRRAER